MSDPRKPVFELIKTRLPSVWNDIKNIAILDDALDLLGFPKDFTPTIDELPTPDWTELAIPLIQEFEGYAKDLGDGRVQAYPDPGTGGAPWTIAWGSTGPGIGPDTIWTREQAVQRFRRDLEVFANGVEFALDRAPTTDAQQAAMVSLAYNVGLGSFKSSTLLKKHKAKDYAGAKAEFARWNRAGGRVMAGLTRRRAAEAKLYGGG